MENSSKNNLVNDIENRLDDFFDESEEGTSAEKDVISLEKLKSVVLSIDWEITEECLNDLIDETDALLPHFIEDRYPHTLLRMLKAVGLYIQKRKAQSHPDAIKRIMSVFSSIEKLTDNSHIEETSKKQIVAREILEFKKLKEQVERQSGGSPAPPASAAGQHIESEKLDKAVNDLEKLKSQFEELKKEFDDFRNS